MLLFLLYFWSNKFSLSEHNRLFQILIIPNFTGSVKKLNTSECHNVESQDTKF